MILVCSGLLLFQFCENQKVTNPSIESARVIVKEFIEKNKLHGLSISVSKGAG